MKDDPRADAESISGASGASGDSGSPRAAGAATPGGAPHAGEGPGDAAEWALLERARGGDREAFDGLVALHLPRVWKTVWQVTRHHEDCEDVVQDVFLTAWRSLPEFRGEARLSTWLHTIAITRALNHKGRSAEKIRRASGPLESPAREDDPHPGISPAVEAAARRGASPLQELEADELMRRLAECLEKLPAAWRAVVAMRDGEENSYEDIARALSVALGTVRSRLARARVALRACAEGQAS